MTPALAELVEKLRLQAQSIGFVLVPVQKPTQFKEPLITINGQLCHEGEAMTLRVALEGLAGEMSKKNALGKDAMGESIREGYLRSVYSIRTKMHGTDAEREVESAIHYEKLHGPNWKELLK